MSKAAEISSLMIMGAIVTCCVGIVAFVINFTLWYPDRIMSAQVWAFAGGAWTILTVLGGAIINNVLSSKPSQPPAK
mgnify:FL=1